MKKLCAIVLLLTLLFPSSTAYAATASQIMGAGNDKGSSSSASNPMPTSTPKPTPTPKPTQKPTPDQKSSTVIDEVEMKKKAAERDEIIQNAMLSEAYDRVLDSLKSDQKLPFREGVKKYGLYDWTVKEYTFDEDTNEFSGEVKANYVLVTKYFEKVYKKSFAMTGTYDEITGDVIID